MHESKADGLKQEEVQEEGDASVGPASVDQQQPLQEPELGQGKIGVLHCLTSFHSRYSHTDMSRWGLGRTRDRCENMDTRRLIKLGLVRLTLDHVYIVGSVPDRHGHRVGVFPDQSDDVGLLSGGYATAQH